MTDDIDVVKVAKETSIILGYIDKAIFPDTGCKSYDHLGALLHQVITGKVTGGKAHRYLGWAQCAICMYTNTSSKVFRDLTRRHKKEV